MSSDADLQAAAQVKTAADIAAEEPDASRMTPDATERMDPKHAVIRSRPRLLRRVVLPRPDAEEGSKAWGLWPRALEGNAHFPTCPTEVALAAAYRAASSSRALFARVKAAERPRGGRQRQLPSTLVQRGHHGEEGDVIRAPLRARGTAAAGCRVERDGRSYTKSAVNASALRDCERYRLTRKPAPNPHPWQSPSRGTGLRVRPHCATKCKTQPLCSALGDNGQPRAAQVAQPVHHDSVIRAPYKPRYR